MTVPKKTSKIYIPSKCAEDWKNVIPSEHWIEDCSAYELAHSWEAANPNLPPEIQALFGDSAELLVATPEHTTELCGIGRGSVSDVLIFVRTKGKVCVVTVEGKKEESFGPTVSDWLAEKSDNKNRKTRLKCVSEKLGVSHLRLDDIRYQLLHRTAAALIEADRLKADRAAMIVHSFSENPGNFDDFKDFLDLFDFDQVERDKFYTINKFRVPLKIGWATGKKVTQ